jgi:hypothetical protein
VLRRVVLLVRVQLWVYSCFLKLMGMGLGIFAGYYDSRISVAFIALLCMCHWEEMGVYYLHGGEFERGQWWAVFGL